MSEKEWLNYMLDICRTNAMENVWISDAQFAPDTVRDFSSGCTSAYNHIETYILDRLREIKHGKKG